MSVTRIPDFNNQTQNGMQTFHSSNPIMSHDDFKHMPTVAVDASLPIKNVRSLNQSHVSRFSAAGAAVIGGAPYSGLPLGLQVRRDSRTQMEGGSVSEGVRARAEVNMD